MFPAGEGLAFAGGLLWESGSTTADARGGSADLSLSRLGVVLEPRFAPRPWAFAFARISPAWLRGRASLTDASSPLPLATSFSSISVDASLGFAGKLNWRARGVGIWALGDLGYGWAPTQQMALAPSLSEQDRAKAGVTTLSDLAPRGLFLRLGLALSF